MRAIDLFSGLGGFTEGARQAGWRVIWAGNHSREACDWHSRNHPTTECMCQDLQQANWLDVPGFDALLASAACQGHTHARGKERPHHDACRATAWAIISCMEVHIPHVLIMENVVGFLRWKLYPAWTAALAALGYRHSVNLLDAADHGVPQNRPRLVVVATRSRAPLELGMWRKGFKIYE